MKKVIKIIGIAALALVLVCNLEYALFSGDMKNTPLKAVANYNAGNVWFCGNGPSTSYLQGEYYLTANDYWGNWYSSPYPPYAPDPYVYMFQMSSNGTKCAPNEESSSERDVPPYIMMPYYYITAMTGTTDLGINP